LPYSTIGPLPPVGDVATGDEGVGVVGAVLVRQMIGWSSSKRMTTAFELEVIAVQLPVCLLVIHVMPYEFRRTRR
jgi:hypothetical protein